MSRTPALLLSRAGPGARRTWLSIRVDLIAGHGEALWPRPGRVFAASRSHTFAQLATAIDDAFARWDRSHLHEFTRADGYRLGILSDEDYDPEHLLDYRRVTLGRLSPGEQFAYVFDFGDQWEHLCTVGPRRIDVRVGRASCSGDRIATSRAVGQ